MKQSYASLADYFDRSGRTRADAAKDWKVTEATISRWISGTRQLKGEQAIQISEDTGVPLAALLVPPQKAAS